MSVDITYGAYSFATSAGPIPFLTVTKNFNIAPDGTYLVSKYNATLDGTLTPIKTGVGGITTLDGMQDALMSAFSLQGQLFRLTCDATVLISEYPRINNIRLDKSNDNWVYTTPYTIDLEWDGSGISGMYVQDAQETWNIEFDETAYFDWSINGTGDTNTIIARITHSVNAKGIPHYSGAGIVKPAWQQARDFVASRLGFDANMISQTGVLNLDGTDFTPYNHMRVVQIDELGGSYGVNETWTILDNTYLYSCGNAIEDFTATVKYNTQDGLTNVDVQGSIQGLETRSYSGAGFSIGQTKWAAASGAWEVIRPKLLGRAKFAAGSLNRPINPSVLNYSVGHSPTKGVISYGYEFDNRACNFFSGALFESISVSDTYPTDVFNEVRITGRAYGPILQDISTITSSRRNVQIELVMTGYDGCSSPTAMVNAKPTGQINSFLCSLEQQISGASMQVFKSQDSDNWNPKTGRYSRTVEWTYTQCGGTAPSTSFCS